MANIVLHYSNNPPFTSEDHRKKGLGGTENFACNVATTLVKLGHKVRFYNMVQNPVTIDGVEWANVSNYNPSEKIDLLISFRMREVFQLDNKAKVKVLILADTESVGLGDLVRAGKLDYVMAVSKWQLDKIAAEEGLVDHPCWILGSNGVNKLEYGNFDVEHRPTQEGLCLHMSTPERGLWQVLKVWELVERNERITKSGIKPQLLLFSSFKGWGVSDEDNSKMAEGVYREIEKLQNRGFNVVNKVHANVYEIREAQMKADLFLYPTNFKETYCMSLQESLYGGTIPVVSNIGALPERLKQEYSRIISLNENGDDSTNEGYLKVFANNVIWQIVQSKEVKQEMRKHAHEAAAKHEYSVIIPEWLEQLKVK